MRLAPQETRTYHVTSVTAQRRSVFQVTANIELFVQTLFDYRAQKKYLLHAFVLMPEHFHVLLTPAPEVSLEKAVQFIKGGCSFRLRHPHGLWMHSFNETQIMDAERFFNCKLYIEANPVRRGLVSTPEDYRYSSATMKDLDAMPAHMQKARG